MGKKKIRIMAIDPLQMHDYVVDSGICLDCNWDGLLKDADTDTDWDEFKMQEVPNPICPKCGGGLDDYYISNLKN